MEEMKKSDLVNLFEKGIPVSRADFRDAVNNADNTPENYFSDSSQVRSRNVEMRCTPIGLVCFHKGAYIWVPNESVKFARFK